MDSFSAYRKTISVLKLIGKSGKPLVEGYNVTMSHTESTMSLPATLLRRLGRISRFLVFLCTAGWLFPHASTEGMNLTQIQNDHLTKKP